MVDKTEDFVLLERTEKEVVKTPGPATSVVVETPGTNVITVEKDKQVAVQVKESTVITEGQMGPPGNSADLIAINDALTDLDQRVSVLEGAANYIHNQGLASTVWVVNHNLGKAPAVTVVDSANNEVEGEINHTNDNQCVLTFSAPFSGRAFIN